VGEDVYERIDSDKGDCKEIKNYFKEIELEYEENVFSCIENSNGELITLKLSNDDLEQKDIDKLLSYNTITSLYYQMYTGYYEEESTIKNRQRKFPSAISKLSNLKELYISYYEIEEWHTHSTYYTNSIEKNIISNLPKDLRKLGLTDFSLTQDNINEMASLPNLENLILSNCENINDLDFSPFEKSEKITNLEIYFRSGRFYSGHSVGKNIIKYFKHLKYLSLYEMEMSQDNINEIGTLTNLEKLKTSINSSLNLEPLRNLNNLSSCNIEYYESKMDDSEIEDIDFNIELKLPKNIKQLTTGNIKISLSNIEEISTLLSLEELNIIIDPSINLDSLTKLNKLSTLNIFCSGDYLEDLKAINLKIPKNLKNLQLNEVKLTQSTLEEISSCTTLEKLLMFDCSFDEKLNLDSFKNLKNLLELTIIYEGNRDYVEQLKEIPDSFFSLENLQKLSIKDQKLTTIPDKIENLKNLKVLDLRSNEITNLPEAISKLENLEYLNLNSNLIYAVLPESFNNLSKLETIYLNGNLDIKGKTLTNENLKICQYGEEYNLCIAKDMKCLDEYDDNKYEKCSEDNISGDNIKCGKSFGKCPFGQCCSKDGICGISESYCLLSEGCQLNYGSCNNECDQINYYLSKRKIEKDYTINECVVNNEGKVTKLGIYTFDLKEEDIREILSYDTITSLSYYYKCSNIKDTDTEFKIITNMKNLKELQLTRFENFDGGITQNGINLISQLTNLEKLNFDQCDFEDGKVSLKSLENLKKLKELTIHSTMYNVNILKELPNNIPSLTYLNIHDMFLTQDQFNDITSLTNLRELYLYNYYDKKINFDKLKNLKNLNILMLDGQNEEDSKEIPESIFSLSNLKNLTIANSAITSISEGLTNLKNLRYLDLQFNEITVIPSNIELFKNLDTLYLNHNKIKVFPEELTNCEKLEDLNLNVNEIKELPESIDKLKNLKTLDLFSNKLTKFPKNIEKLSNLENLGLGWNEINDILPESYNSLQNLKSITLWENKNISGQVLSNPSLEECEYESFYDLCIDSNIEYTCFDNKSYHFKPCESNSTKSTTSTTLISSTTTTTIISTTEQVKTEQTSTSKETKTVKSQDAEETTTDDKITTTKSQNAEATSTNDKITSTKFQDAETTSTSDKTSTTESDIPLATNEFGQCGRGFGRCPNGQCCSKFGYCGSSSDYCSLSKECQPQYGECDDDSEGECGPGKGTCPLGQCCSKYGYCGTSSDHCDLSNGCQTAYGQCNDNTNGRCGEGVGNCPYGQCCSKYGYCGASSDYCSVSKGCQYGFGECINDKNTYGRCGRGVGQCPRGQCCSRYGYCGTSEEHCALSNYCQSEFGNCTNDTHGKCGKGIGNCPTGQCCSKHGYCGVSTEYCALSKGCQSEFGKCTNDTKGKCGKGIGNCPKGQCCSKHGYCGTGTKYCDSGCQSEFGKCN